MKILQFLEFSTAAVLSASFLGYFGCVFYRSPPTSSGDCAAWAGAIGAVGALIGTIRLATKQSREKRSAELNLASLVAAGVMPSVASARFVVFQVERAIVREAADGFAQHYLEHAHSLLTLCSWNAESIVALSVLPHQTAFHLENARARIGLAQKLLADRAADNHPGDTFDPLRFADMVARVLTEARDSLNIAYVQCEKITPDRSQYA